MKFGKKVKPVTYEATRRCVTCYGGILQRNHNVLWATNITNDYIHVPDCRDFGRYRRRVGVSHNPPTRVNDYSCR